MSCSKVTRDWFIHAVNIHMLKFLAISKEEAANIPADICNVLHFIFNPVLNTRQRLTGGRGGWNSIAERNVYGFKKNNEQTLNDPHITDLISSLKTIPDSGFEDIWNEVQAKPYTQSPFYTADYVTEMEMGVDRNTIIKFRSLHISHGDLEFPSVIAYLPVGNESAQAFKRLGLPAFEQDNDIPTRVMSKYS